MATHQATNLPRPVLLLTCILALATGLALLGVATAFTDRPVSTRSTVATIAPAEQFFAAVNEVLRTGDTAPPGRLAGRSGSSRPSPKRRRCWPH